MTRHSIAVVGFGLAAFCFLFAAIFPSIRGGSLNAGLFVFAVVFFVLAIAVRRKAPKPPSSPGA